MDSPPGIIRLRTILGRSRREYSSLQKETQRCMLDVSFLLHDLNDVLPSFLEDRILIEDEPKAVEETINYVHTVLDDFRLMDLKESRLKENNNGR